MEKCSPVEIRKNLESVKAFEDAGIDFVAVPAKNQSHKNSLHVYVGKILNELIEEGEEA